MDFRENSSDIRYLFFIAFTIIISFALSFDYMVKNGYLEAFIAIFGAGLMLTIVVSTGVLISKSSDNED